MTLQAATPHHLAANSSMLNPNPVAVLGLQQNQHYYYQQQQQQQQMSSLPHSQFYHQQFNPYQQTAVAYHPPQQMHYQTPGSYMAPHTPPYFAGGYQNKRKFGEISNAASPNSYNSFHNKRMAFPASSSMHSNSSSTSSSCAITNGAGSSQNQIKSYNSVSSLSTVSSDTNMAASSSTKGDTYIFDTVFYNTVCFIW